MRGIRAASFRRRRLLAGCLRLAICGVPALASTLAGEQVAHADDLAAALKRFDDGRKAFEGGEFETALLAFQESYALSASPNSRLYIARCFRALGKPASAYTAFRFAEREAQDRLTATGEKRYAATRDAASAEAAALAPKVPRLTVGLPPGAPPDLVVKRNGVVVPREALGVAVETDPGAVVVEATGTRLVPFHQEITLAEGQQARVDVTVTRLPTATLALRFKTRPAGLSVNLDTAPVDASGLDAPRELDVGAHALVVAAPGYVTLRWQKTLADGDGEVVDVDLQPSVHSAAEAKGLPRWIFFGVSGAAVASLVTASVVAVSAKSKDDDERSKDVYARSLSTRDSIRSASTTANALFVAGGVLGVGAVVLAFVTQWRSADTTTALAIEPWIGTAGLGIGTHARF